MKKNRIILCCPYFYDSDYPWVSGMNGVYYDSKEANELIDELTSKIKELENFIRNQHEYYNEDTGIQHKENCALFRPHSHSADCDCGFDDMKKKMLSILEDIK